MSPQTPTPAPPFPEETTDTMLPTTPDPLHVTIADGINTMSLQTPTSDTGSASPSAPTLLTIPRELRDKIVRDVLVNPTRPNFEATPMETKFKHYFAIGFVSTQLYDEAKEVLESSGELVIVSSNWEYLKDDMECYAVPIVSSHHIRTINFHGLRIHFECPNREKKALQSVAILSSYLPVLSKCLRAMSLDAPHPPSQLMGTSISSTFFRMSMRIQFGEQIMTRRKDQIRLLQGLKEANSIGVIKILKLKDPSLAGILPGYNGFHYNFNPNSKLATNSTPSMTRSDRILMLQKTDGEDHVSLCDWKLDFAAQAKAANNYKLAEFRYREVIRFVGACHVNNKDVLRPELDFLSRLNLRVFRAGVGLVDALIWLQKWEDAEGYIRHVLDDIPEEHRPPKEEVQLALEFQKQVGEHYTCAKEGEKGNKSVAPLPSGRN